MLLRDSEGVLNNFEEEDMRKGKTIRVEPLL